MTMKVYFKKHFGAVLLTCFLLLCNSVLQVYAATKMAQLANYLIGKQLLYFCKTLLIIFTLWFTSFIISLLESYVQETVTQSMLTDIRAEVTNNIVELTQSEFKSKPVDYYESYLQNDTNMIQKEGIDTFFLIIRFSGNAIFSLIALYTYSIWLFIAAIFLVIIMIIVPKICKKYLSNGIKGVSEANEQFLKITSSGLHGYETLYAFNVLGELKKLVNRGSNLLKQANVKNTVRRSIIGIVTGVINIGSQLIIIGITGYLHFQGLLTAGAILATAELATKVFDSTNIVDQYFSQLLSTTSLFEKFAKLVPSRKLMRNTQNFATMNFPKKFVSLSFENVSFSYPGSKNQILTDFSFTFNKNNFYKLNGKSGRGKSTLLKLATNQLQPQKGKVLLNGIDIKTIPQTVINNIIVYVPQTVTIFPQSIDYNIKLGRNISGKLLERVKNNYKIDNSWNPDSLSGGEQQRVALARILDPKGKLILLDESFSNIDLKSAKDILNNLLSHVETVIVVSHRNEEIDPQIFNAVDIK